MRVKALDDGGLLQVLQPLSLRVGAIWVPPVLAVRERRVVDVTQVHASIDAARDEILEGPPVRSLPPWHYEQQLAPTPRPARFLSAFTRMVALHPARLDSLPAWWRRNARGERVDIASRLHLEEPRHEPLGLWRMDGSLRSPWRLRSLAVELWMWPHLGDWTQLALEPQREVHVGRRYFSSGQRVLDVLCSRLICELDANGSHPEARRA